MIDKKKIKTQTIQNRLNLYKLQSRYYSSKQQKSLDEIRIMLSEVAIQQTQTNSSELLPWLLFLNTKELFMREITNLVTMINEKYQCSIYRKTKVNCSYTIIYSICSIRRLEEFRTVWKPLQMTRPLQGRVKQSNFVFLHDWYALNQVHTWTLSHKELIGHHMLYTKK